MRCEIAKEVVFTFQYSEQTHKQQKDSKGPYGHTQWSLSLTAEDLKARKTSTLSVRCIAHGIIFVWLCSFFQCELGSWYFAAPVGRAVGDALFTQMMHDLGFPVRPQSPQFGASILAKSISFSTPSMDAELYARDRGWEWHWKMRAELDRCFMKDRWRPSFEKLGHAFFEMM